MDQLDEQVQVAQDEGSALIDLVIITGFSGAGKSTAMAAFEDEGYFCVDNLPSEMIRSLVDLFMHAGSKVQHAAVVSDVRGGTYFEGLAEMLDDLRAAGVKRRVLFLDADEQSLLTRYKETRRRHPLAPEGSVTDGIARERELLRAAARSGGRRDRHVRPDRRDAAPQARATSCCRRARRGAWRSRSRASASSTARPVTPTCCSTSASSRTRTTSRTCGR